MECNNVSETHFTIKRPYLRLQSWLYS